MSLLNVPREGEYAPFHLNYINAVPAGGPMNALRDGMAQMMAITRPLNEAKGNYAYAPGKWTLKELIGHIVDTERIFSYRALRVARGDKTPLPGFEQDDYIANGNFNSRTLVSIVNEYEALRRANLSLFESFSADAIERITEISGVPVSARTLVWITAGHEQHHLGILKERYLPGI